MENPSNLLNGYGQPVQLSPEQCSPQSVGIIIDSQKQISEACETISFTVSNEGDERYLIFGPRGLSGNDSFYPTDKFQGKNFADSSDFLVNATPNGGAFQSFNYKCGQTSYLLRSVTLRKVAIDSALASAYGYGESYGCDPDNICNAKKSKANCLPCSNNNSTFSDVQYDLRDFPIDYLHAFGILIPAGTELLPVTVTVDVEISMIATAHVYVPCGGSITNAVIR